MSFVFVSGRLCLDFVGTRKWRRRPEPDEQLATPGDLAAWVMAAGIVDRPPTAGPADLAAALQVREAVYRSVERARGGGTLRRADIALLNEVGGGSAVVRRMTSTGKVRATGTIAQVLATLVVDALDLLGRPEQLDRVRECADPDCTRLYIDTSRGRTRRWCGMGDCGNRAKAARFRRRQAAGGR